MSRSRNVYLWPLVAIMRYGLPYASPNTRVEIRSTLYLIMVSHEAITIYVYLGDEKILIPNFTITDNIKHEQTTYNQMLRSAQRLKTILQVDSITGEYSY